ncbi:MAG: undecaprenyl-phosphate glucose phosphotransferase [Anaerolineae bacterium]|jgi:exopolysaccharide biosynthesis polyprenyl glycosylphosphotransferase|nr:undecaprenyl-phosphate glucose phosphotransferase [Anaerolineae bacterium]MDH7474367.1 undecaprenyl-phosphate glucose phosphotransferase [Anaerolineae bacterium]
MLKRFGTNLTLALLVSDLVLTELALYLASYLRPRLGWGTTLISQQARLSPYVYLMVAAIWGVTFLVLSVYDAKRTLRAVDEIQVVCVATSMATLIFAGALYLSFRQVSRLLFVYFFALDLVFLLALRVFLRLIFKLLNGRSHQSRRVLIIGAGDVGVKVARMIHEHAWTGLELVGYLDDDPAKSDNGLPVLGTLAQAQYVVQTYQVNEVIIALPLRAHERMEELVQSLQKTTVNIRVVPDFFAMALFQAKVEDFGGMPLIGLRVPALSEFDRLIKRAFDLIVGSVLLLISLPIMAIIAIAIKLDSPGPAIFRQERVGENGRPFLMYKFRSMVDGAEQMQEQVNEVDKEGHIIHKKPDDPRVTRVGRFIRRFSLDELPQLFNVLKGEMSLVGPRPELPWLVEKYKPWQRARFTVPQGITGWWQVNGRSNKLMHEHTEEDIFYIKNYSLLLDILILWKTVGAVLKREGAY